MPFSRSFKKFPRKPRPAWVPPPYQKPEGDPQFEALDLPRRTLILSALDWMLEIDATPNAHQRAHAIAERYQGTDTEGKKRPGLSAVSIYRRYLAWVKGGRDWRSLDKYRTLRQAPSATLESYNLTTATAHEYFARHGLTLAQWAHAHSFDEAAVSRAINGTRITALSQKILDTLSAELRAEPGHWHRAVHALRAEVMMVSAKLDRLEKQLPRWR